jgi:hypothetical protein
MKDSLVKLVGGKPTNNYSIKVASGLNLPNIELPIQPYSLGAWLGDGTSTNSELTSADIEIVNAIEKDGYGCNKRRKTYSYSIGSKEAHRNDSTGRFSSNGSFYTLLKENNLLNNKHIPSIYLRAGNEQRLALIQGLMDTDGTISKSGNCCFDNMNKSLVDGLYELLMSVGIQARKRTKKARLYDKDCGTCYRLNFTTSIPVFTLPRKLVRLPKEVRATQTHRYITDIVKIDSIPVKCISVDNADHLFLAGESFIPTHNSSCGIIEELHRSCQTANLDTLVICPADTQSNSWYDNIGDYVLESKDLDIIR